MTHQRVEETQGESLGLVSQALTQPQTLKQVSSLSLLRSSRQTPQALPRQSAPPPPPPTPSLGGLETNGPAAFLPSSPGQQPRGKFLPGTQRSGGWG